MNIALFKKKITRILLISLLGIMAFPVCWALWFMITGSFLPLDELSATIGPVLNDSGAYAQWILFPSWPTLQPLLELLLDTPQFFIMFWNTFKIVVPSVAGQFLIATPAAWALSRLRFRGRNLLLSLYIVLMLMPFQVTMVPNYLMIDKLNIMDTLWAVIGPSAFSAFPVFIMTKGFDSVHLSILEAAKVDGASHIQTFFRIGIPLGTPGILAALVLGFLESWNAIEQPMTFLKTPANWPLSLYLPQIAAEKMSLSMAASLLMLLPAALTFLFGQKYLILGIQSAGMKE